MLKIAIQLLHIHLMPTRGLFEETNKYYSKHQCSAAFSDFCMRFRNILTVVQDDSIHSMTTMRN